MIGHKLNNYIKHNKFVAFEKGVQNVKQMFVPKQKKHKVSFLIDDNVVDDIKVCRICCIVEVLSFTLSP